MNKMDLDFERERLVEESSDKEDDMLQHVRVQKKGSWPWNYVKRSFPQCAIMVLFSSSVCLNLWWFWSTTHPVPSFAGQQQSYLGQNEWVGVPFLHDWARLVDQEDGNRSHYADKEWQSTFPPGGGIVSVSKSFAAEHGVPAAAVSPENEEEMIYMVAGYHQLHCLMVMRETLYQLNGTSSDTDPILWDHVLHCLDAVRQGLTCFLDTTLINLAEKWPGVPNGQMHTCRNSALMYEWAGQREHAMPVDVDPNTRKGMVDVNTLPTKNDYLGSHVA